MSAEQTDSPSTAASEEHLTRSTPETLLVHSIQVAEQVAHTEEMVAATLDQLAVDQPHRSDDLRAKSRQARAVAAAERRWAATHRKQVAALPAATSLPAD